MKKEVRPPMSVIEVNWGSKMDSRIESALIVNFPKDLGGDIFTDTDGSAMPVKLKNGGESNKKYINWGNDNRLPTAIVNRAYFSPYVAPSLNHIVNSLFSSGLKPYYVYYVYQNGSVKREQIEYEAAGLWLRSRIRDLKSEMDAIIPTATMQGAPQRQPAPDHSNEIEQLEKDLKKWEETYAKWKLFQEDNNIPGWLLEQASDLAYFWNWYPTLELGIGVEGNTWTPEIVKVGHLDATCTRKGVMNSYGDITYCVYSREFGGQTESAPVVDDSEQYRRQIVIDALSPDNAVKQLRGKVEKQKEQSLRSRTTRYVLPMRMPTPGKPYYAMPTWYSIFKGGMYYYLLAMLNRRATRLKNGTMFSRIIHLNESYVDYEWERQEAVTEEEKIAVYNKLVGELKEWLKNPDNNGTALVAMTKTIDGKVVKWVEIETVEPPKEDASVKDDIAEIANVILYAMGIHPQTVGALPGKDKVASGSEARELNTLQQLDLFAQKMMLMYPYYIVKSFNEWDEHLYWDIPLHVLTTLDKNKRGVEEMSN